MTKDSDMVHGNEAQCSKLTKRVYEKKNTSTSRPHTGLNLCNTLIENMPYLCDLGKIKTVSGDVCRAGSMNSGCKMKTQMQKALGMKHQSALY